MAFITFIELIDAVLMSALIGYIFYPYFSRFNVFRKHNVHEFTEQFKRRFNWSDFMFSVYLIAPAIIFHELGHKFVAIWFGHDATFFGGISLNKLRVSKAIKELVADDIAVMVIEHDLIILDHMTDLIQIMYGRQTAWGTVSQPRTTRVGINTYLSGFLKEENVRFRDKEIKFYARPPVESSKKVKLTEWNDMEKQLDKFRLTANAGAVNLNEVIGLVGENGIGKTTFVKLVAGELKPDSGESVGGSRVSYKPQYLLPTDDIVMIYLDEAIKKHKSEIIDPLDIEPLFMSRLDELSGGELQKVMIAKALGQEVDLILLDEPSAHLDVEQRLVVSRVIKDIVSKYNRSCLVVDHDLLFIDYLSDRIIVCDGKPAIHGSIEGPFKMEDGMNRFLEKLKISVRRDLESNRPRINKPGSQMERQQISEGKLYYTS